MARTFPTLGMSPIDAYTTGELPVAYFEQAITQDDTTERHCVEIVGTPTMYNQGNYAALAIYVTPTFTETGMWAGAIFSKVTVAAATTGSGYVDAGEFEVNLNGTAGVNLDCHILTLNAGGNCTSRYPYSSWIWLNDYSSTAYMPSLLNIPYGTVGTKSNSTMLSTYTDGAVITHSIKIYFPGNAARWILCTSTAPASS